jgi:hypothetical protein
MKSAKLIIPNRFIAQIVDEIRTRCVNSGNVVVGGDGGPPAKKKIKTNASAAAPVPSVDGCPWIGPIGGLNMHAAECGFVKVDCPNAPCVVSVYRHELAAHAAVCPYETIKCGFGGGKCNGTYKRGVGSSDHDREASQAHLNIAMGLINSQMRTIERMERKESAQTRTIYSQACTIKVMEAAQASSARTIQAQARTIEEMKSVSDDDSDSDDSSDDSDDDSDDSDDDSDDELKRMMISRLSASRKAHSFALWTQ